MIRRKRIMNRTGSCDDGAKNVEENESWDRSRGRRQ